MKPPPPPGASATDVDWSVDFETLRREELFRTPPRDRTAFPRLAALGAPHLHSFNSIVDDRGLLFHALKDIGTKVFLDRAADDGAGDGGKLSVRIKEVFLDKSVLPPSNKFTARDRLVLPAECRERQASYRGRLRARLETCVGAAPAWVETVVDLGLVPIMVRVSRPCSGDSGVGALRPRAVLF